MLISLKIENFALIDRLDLEFSPGLTVFTGETGAGKSIILDALDAVLGGKLTSKAIRSGQHRGLIEAIFTLTPLTAQWLREQDIEPMDNHTLVCSRELKLSPGAYRSWSRLNGIIVRNDRMKTLRQLLVSITAQGQTVQLGDPQRQREWLDLYGEESLLVLRDGVAEAYGTARDLRSQLDRQRNDEQYRLQRIDILQYQLSEFAQVQPTSAGELKDLEQESDRLSHSVELHEKSYQIYQALYQGERSLAAADLLGQAKTLIEDILPYDTTLQPILELVNEALVRVDEAGRQINAYSDSVETDPERLEEIAIRMGELKQLCRKYGPSLEDAIAYWQTIQAELDRFTATGESIEQLERDYDRAITELKLLCDRLHQQRQKASLRLEGRLVEELKPLAMDKVKFKVALTPTEISATGSDRITFGISPNPGEPIAPLAKTASGGEMSRFLLAITACFSQINPVNTLVFDEIDAGVSGRVAEAIADKLHLLSQHNQILCVTHQPLIAALADRHLHVRKETIAQEQNDNGKLSQRTVVRVTPLDRQQRSEELAQLAGGNSAADALSFARSLLQQADSKRQKTSSTELS
ncbi:DNA repair protein RecN [Roseofilum casamattae]|uniref:DNA repair protein RecN n=1 Tax=Roseofilum casamattae BLCC-M143 TaxID=3022442 RepID=A0ABT7BSU7_9CYAN|nr:DNA repair protein RecN [Roseofilum casamattae]MDJ1181594.1 DNA repair protein RecN [Roseofilum casamattae BLCC-M143]